MTKCEELKAKLTDWILDELPASEATDLELHVKQCSGCARALDEFRRVHQALARHLQDKKLPAHLVFLWGNPKSQISGLLASVWRTAALAGVAAVVFLAILSVGYGGWIARQSHPAPAEKTVLSRAEVQAMIANEVAQGLAQQRKEFELANQKLTTGLREERAQELALVARKLQYLEATQKVVWKESQQQGALVELIARNSLRGGSTQPNRP
jgi:hypothetical protein